MPTYLGGDQNTELAGHELGEHRRALLLPHVPVQPVGVCVLGVGGVVMGVGEMGTGRVYMYTVALFVCLEERWRRGAHPYLTAATDATNHAKMHA